MRGLALSLIKNGKIRTTEAKAKELRPYVEKLITKGKSDSVATRRGIAAQLGQPKSSVIQKFMANVVKQYNDRSGGYTRVIKLGETKAGRREAIIELV